MNTEPIKFRSFKDIFGDNSNDKTELPTKPSLNDIQEIPLENLISHRNHTYRLGSKEKLQELADSIEQNGVLNPAIVRPLEDGRYELISGHRRKAACEICGKNTIPAIVKNIDDDTADILMVDCNLQREDISISERAMSCRLKYDAMKRQGKRTDLVSDENGGKRITQLMGEEENKSHITIFRYIRLGNLCDELLDLADLTRFDIVTGVELSYLSQTAQLIVAQYLQTYNKVKLTKDYAKQLRELDSTGELTEQNMADIFKKPQCISTPKAVKIPFKQIRSCFTDEEITTLDEKGLIDFVIKAVKAYQHNEMGVISE